VCGGRRPGDGEHGYRSAELGHGEEVNSARWLQEEEEEEEGGEAGQRGGTLEGLMRKLDYASKRVRRARPESRLGDRRAGVDAGGMVDLDELMESLRLASEEVESRRARLNTSKTHPSA